MVLLFIAYLLQSYVNISLVAGASVYWIILGVIVQQYWLAEKTDSENVGVAASQNMFSDKNYNKTL